MHGSYGQGLSQLFLHIFSHDLKNTNTLLVWDLTWWCSLFGSQLWIWMNDELWSDTCRLQVITVYSILYSLDIYIHINMYIIMYIFTHITYITDVTYMIRCKYSYISSIDPLRSSTERIHRGVEKWEMWWANLLLAPNSLEPSVFLLRKNSPKCNQMSKIIAPNGEKHEVITPLKFFSSPLKIGSSPQKVSCDLPTIHF